MANYNSKFSGPQIDEAIGFAQNAVRCNDAQTLTDTQKTQARGNINAAPGGFGLGGAAKVLTPADNLNDVWQSGWYAWDAAPQNAPTAGGSLIPYCSMNVLNKGGNYNIHQIARTFEGYEIHRYYDGSKQTWSEWAWVNPPMMAGVEYRTTEFYLGKPVYTKLVDCGSMPNSTGKTVHGGISNGESLVGICGEYYNSTTSVSLPYTSGDSTIAKCSAYISSGDCIIGLWAKNNESAQNARVLIKYTKTTD